MPPSLGWLSITHTKGSTVHGALARPNPWKEASVSARSFTGPCTGGLKGGWGKKVGRAVVGGVGGARGHRATRKENRERIKTELHGR